ncbi:MAG: HlyD family efflux transporter periplasmic adaptor subunit [Flavobacteriales bacterium]|jgi:adhesin transport system membrane fusion protein|nr:HlyD family efflux transporter periplasmic adaptor subunit [Flavobacteriales bacterium]MBK6883772.1 HlyD family efflux transporter periplasmic adaptor subunit [Flavobacteriales bacterium]MBK7103306.1 HlyD family efflux transporter periplasmic adaptor subunit [Flavobacteriales bacterium]MBK7620535.1 HlyD family efflux transporter periplasmic adaptor subunit [Flavobacteriales bacterium]MBK8531378.1 HlyD family efflux transporter periplasmic adaptor subunit [Flavobacteriales bacterium]
MLDLSPQNPVPVLDRSSFASFRTIGIAKANELFAKWLIAICILVLLGMFLPWTQNIRARGTLTSLSPDQRPQTLHSIIPGRLEEWFVQEGQLVEKGDTILRLSEVKAEYFDPLLLDRTQQQITAKEMTARSYDEKVRSLDAQIDALSGGLRIKLEQAQNKILQAGLKIQSDSIRVVAARTEIKVADDQYARGEQQFKEGLISKVELEKRQVAQQRANATLIDAKNKLLEARNELLNAQLEVNGIRNDYRDKLSKAESEKFASMSQFFTTEGEVSKMQVDLANFTVRAGNYYVTAPQQGYITKAVVTGIGETVKEGDDLVTIMPARFDLAVELYVRPMDMPLVNAGQKVRFIFDGWPSIVFSGWPNTSYGTFGGTVVAIDNFISPNGKYRILVGPDPDDDQWPKALRVGGGAVGFALMSDVPIWYELWRQVNGFPPDLYTDVKDVSTKEDKEK